MKHLLILALLVALAGAQNIQYWSRCEGNFDDMSGNGRDGVMDDTVAYEDASGSTIAHFAADGTSWITLPSFAFPTGYGAFMFAAWLKWDTVSAARYVTYPPSWDFGLAVGYPLDTTLRYYGEVDGDAKSYDCNNYFSGYSGVRVHVAIWQSCWAGDSVYFYRNGVQIYALPHTATASVTYPGVDETKQIGKFHDGSIDDPMFAVTKGLPSYEERSAIVRRHMAGLRPIFSAPQSIDCIGNSITSGTSAADSNGYPWYLQQYFPVGSGIVVRNYGTGGEVTSRMRKRFGGMAEPQYVIIENVNDPRRDTARATTQANIQAMCDSAADWGATSVVLTPTPFKGDAYGSWTAARQAVSDTVRTWIMDTCVCDYAVNVYDSLESSPGSDSFAAVYDFGDHLHPSAAGAVKIAEIIYNTVWGAP